MSRPTRQFNTTRYAPDFELVHPIDVSKPEESMFLLPQGLYHVLFHAPMPDYREWLADRDPIDDYTYLKEVLQHGREPKHWVLKYPLDVGEMETIRRVFPDATFVWTHRDAVTVMGSLCSLADLAQSLMVNRVDREALGRLALELMVEVVDRGRDFRARHRDAVIDVPYHVLASAPERYVPDLYEQLGAKWMLKDGEHLAAVLTRPIRDRKHEYAISSYGLGQHQIEQAFGDYTEWVTSQQINRRPGCC